jgi:hypothetical protein
VVCDTLQRLEADIPASQREQELASHWLDTAPDQPPSPPPAEYPLRPRSRATDTMRRWSEVLCGQSLHHIHFLSSTNPMLLTRFHTLLGQMALAASWFTLDSLTIFLKAPSSAFSSDSTPQTLSEESSWWTHLFGSVLFRHHRHYHPIQYPQSNKQPNSPSYACVTDLVLYQTFADHHELFIDLDERMLALRIKLISHIYI